MESVIIRSVEEFIEKLRVHREGRAHVWFRGEPADTATPLLPRLYRPREDGRMHDENRLLQTFRMRAPTFSDSTPHREDTDQWLFLAQHVGLPTRLLDWSESALVGLHFALLEAEPVIWMLDPMGLNLLSVTPGMQPAVAEFPLTWIHPKNGVNIGSINIAGAWERDARGVDRPVAIRPTNIHPRMSVQRSCFTIHGKDKSTLADQVPQLLKRYAVEPSSRKAMREDLRVLGISHSTVWPDLDGLADELAEIY